MKTRHVPLLLRWSLVLTLVFPLLPNLGLTMDKATLNERLIQAAGCGDLAVVKACLAEGAEVNAASKAPIDPSFRAACRAVFELSSSDLYCIRRDSAIIRAAENNHLAVARFLLEKGADVNSKDALHRTALMRASMIGAFDLVRLLLSNGADVNAISRFGCTALMAAVGRDMTGLDDASERNDRNSMAYAVCAGRVGHPDVVELLLKNGANINARDETGATPLMNAVMSRDLDMVELLLGRGADVSIRDRFGRTALFEATHRDDPRLVKLLVKKGSDVNAACFE